MKPRGNRKKKKIIYLSPSSNLAFGVFWFQKQNEERGVELTKVRGLRSQGSDWNPSMKIRS